MEVSMDFTVSRVAAATLIVALVLASGGCAAHPAQPTTAPKSVAPPVSAAKPGSTYEFSGWQGAGFVARLRLARSLPDRAGESSVTVLMAIRPNGIYLKKHHLGLVGSDKPSMELAAITPTGTTTLGGTYPGDGAFNPAPYVEFDFGGRYSPLSAEATAVRVTLHLGGTVQAAREGTSVTVPVSSIPALAQLDSADPYPRFMR
jgi:hypothetical protein